MREHPPPRLHLLVCVNERGPTDPLGPGCGERGTAVYTRLKELVAGDGATRTVWVTRTFCLGVCPRIGCTVAVQPSDMILSEVTPEDARTVLLPTADPLASLESLQRVKVLDLARRIEPRLTPEDLRNPHDFPALADPEWNYEDGVLAGIQAARVALSACKPGSKH